MIDKDKLLADLRYSSQWNEPCPEWVYRKIKAMEDAPCEDAIDRYAALAILAPRSVEYKEMKALPPVQFKRPTAEPEVKTQMSLADCISREVMKTTKKCWECEFEKKGSITLEGLFCYCDITKRQINDGDEDWCPLHTEFDKEEINERSYQQAVLDMAHAYGNGYEPEGYCVEVEDIQALPTAEPERKRGKWILQDTSYWKPTHAGDIQVNRANLKCSCCGHRLAKAQKVKNFCPNCGADMRGEHDE